MLLCTVCLECLAPRGRTIISTLMPQCVTLKERNVPEQATRAGQPIDIEYTNFQGGVIRNPFCGYLGPGVLSLQKFWTEAGSYGTSWS